MYGNLIDKLQLDNLTDDQKHIAQLVGIDNYKKLVHHFGGCSIYIYKEDTLIKELRDKEIIEKFNGDNYKELALEYNLAERTIREIITDKYKIKCDNQITLFDIADNL